MIFSIQELSLSYNVRSQIDFTRPNVNCEHFGIGCLRYVAAKVWDMVPDEMKNVNDIETFKNNIRKWKSVNCIFAWNVSRILLVETGYQVFLYISNFIFCFIYNFIISFTCHKNLNIFKKHLRLSKAAVKSAVGLSVKKINDYSLSFLAESSILDFVVVQTASLDINC